MSMWHLLWIAPIVIIGGAGGYLLYSAYWLIAILESQNKIHRIIDREKGMSERFCFGAASFILIAAILMSSQLQGIFLVAAIYWAPMAAVAGGSAFMRLTPLPQKTLLSLLAGVFLAVGIFKLENMHVGRQLVPEWTLGVPVGLFAALGHELKNAIKRSNNIAWRTNWPPYDQISYVVGGWLGLMAVHKLYLGFSMRLADLLILLALCLIAVAFSVIAEYLASWALKDASKD